MPNRRLIADEITQANALLGDIRSRIEQLSNGDRELVFAYRRRIFNKLIHDERGTPMSRRKLKLLKWKEQNGLCPICKLVLPNTYTVLDRTVAVDGYTASKTRLIHNNCDVNVQKGRGYA